MSDTDFTKWDSFIKIDNCENLEKYFDARKTFSSSKNFYHYTKLSTINKILESNYLRLSCVCTFNDKVDKEQFGKKAEQRKYYSLCFSSGKSENLSLWYLYSGMDGKGGRLHFKASALKKLLENKKFDIYEFADDKKDPVLRKQDLKIGQDIEFEYGDVLYYKNDSKWEKGQSLEKAKKQKARLKYNTMTSNTFPQDALDEYRSKHKGFLKPLIWYHEKETRLVVKLSDELLAELDKESKFTEKASEYNKYFIAIYIDDVKDKIKIGLAPEIEDESLIFYGDLENIKKHMFKTSFISLSDHKGEIKMKLCDKCEYRCDKIKCSDRVDKGADKK